MRFGSNTPRLETERLILRRFERQDADALFRILSDEEVNRFLPWFPHKSREETFEFLENSVFADYRKEIAYRYALVPRGEDKAIGYLSLLGIDEKERCGDIGYGLLREYWGEGLMTEAVGALIARLKADGFPLCDRHARRFEPRKRPRHAKMRDAVRAHISRILAAKGDMGEF